MMVETLVHCIAHYLVKNKPEFDGINDVLVGLDKATDSAPSEDPPSASIPGHLKSYLDEALIKMQMKPDIKPIADAILNAYDQLNWAVDNAKYYNAGADVGDAYKTGNMHCELIGPGNSFFKSANFRLGLFLLKPNVLYRDHYHPAPEFYLNLTGPNQWRFNHGSWQRYDAGSMLWNASNAIHATQVGDVPFLSIYSWTDHIHEVCSVSSRQQ